MKGACRALWVLLLVLSLAGTGCGKKGPPFLPEKAFNLKVLDLKVDWDGGFFRMSGRLDSPEKAKDMVSGCRVYYAAFPPEQPPCETCPVDYQGSHGFGPEVVQDQGFSCRVPGKMRGQFYIFKVHLIGPDGTEGPASHPVRVAADK